jgi:hypothetical protein
MSRRSVAVTVSCLLLGVVLLGLLLFALLRYECSWYKRASLPPGPERFQYSQDFISALTGLYNAMSPDHDWWEGRFTDTQINSYIEEGFRQNGLESRTLPEGISEPRVAFDTDRIHLAFRYGSGLFSTIISIDLRLWLANQERTVLVLELEGFHAGALPVSARSVLEKVSQFGSQNGIGVAWYRDPESGHPVAVLRFQDDQPKPTLELLAVQPEPGAIVIRGRSTDGSSVHLPIATPESAVKTPGGS